MAKKTVKAEAGLLGIRDIPIDQITISPHNPRRISTNDPAIKELAASIRGCGLLQPVICRPLGDGYELLAGSRRVAATQLIGGTVITAMVHEMSDADALKVTVLENLQRQDLTPLEEARGVDALLKSGRDAKEIARDIGKSVAWVYRRAKLVDLAPEILSDIEAGNMDMPSAGHLEVLARLPEDKQVEAVKNHRFDMFRESAGEFERTIMEDMMLLRSAPFALDEPIATRPPCNGCVKRSGASPMLFHLGEDGEVDTGAIEKDERCLNPDCWNEKRKAFVEEKIEGFKVKAGDNALLIHGENAAYHEKMEHGEAIERYAWEPAKKGAPGAVKALVVSGSGTGTEKWVKVNRSLASDRGDKPKQPPLKARQQAWVIRHVCEKLESAPAPWLTVMEAAAFIEAFGTSCNASYGAVGPDEWHHAEANMLRDGPAFLTALWGQVTPVLLRRMGFIHVADCGKAFDEAMRVAELCKLGTESELLAKAAEKVRGGKSKKGGEE